MIDTSRFLVVPGRGMIQVRSLDDNRSFVKDATSEMLFYMAQRFLDAGMETRQMEIVNEQASPKD